MVEYHILRNRPKLGCKHPISNPLAPLYIRWSFLNIYLSIHSHLVKRLCSPLTEIDIFGKALPKQPVLLSSKWTRKFCEIFLAFRISYTRDNQQNHTKTYPNLSHNNHS